MIKSPYPSYKEFPNFSIKNISCSAIISLITFFSDLGAHQVAQAHQATQAHQAVPPHTSAQLISNENMKAPKYEKHQRMVGFEMIMTLNIKGHNITGPVRFNNVPATILTLKNRNDEYVSGFVLLPNKIRDPVTVTMNGQKIDLGRNHIDLSILMDQITKTQESKLKSFLSQLGNGKDQTLTTFLNSGLVLDISGATNLNLSIGHYPLNVGDNQSQEYRYLMELESRANQYLRLLESGQALTPEQLSLLNQWEQYNANKINSAKLDDAYEKLILRLSELLKNTKAPDLIETIR